MKKDKKKAAKKPAYEKPVLTKFKKLTDVIAQGPSGPEIPLGCTIF